MLADIVGPVGNFLLDILPLADARTPVILKGRLIEIAKWMKVKTILFTALECANMTLDELQELILVLKIGQVLVSVVNVCGYDARMASKQ